MLTKYVDQFPADALQNVIDFVTGKNVDEKKYAQSLYTLLGFTLHSTVGDPAVGETQIMALNLNKENFSFGSLPPWLVPLMLQLAQELIAKYTK